MKLNVYLTFNGQCEEAFKFYEECLGGKIGEMLRYEGTPMTEDVPAEWHNKIMHASINVGDSVLMASDAPPQYQEEAKGFSVALHVNDAAEAERFFAALSENGTVQMPMEETFWAARFGMLVDKFGTPWMINCDKPA